MNFQQLRSVREAVRRGFNLTEVAQILHTSQPGVSRQIRELEEELGVEIFVRAGKRLTGLTPPGAALLPTVERLLLEADNLKRAGQDFSDSATGRLSVAATHSQARYALPQVVRDFRSLFPQISLQLHQGSPCQVAEMLLSGEADIGVAKDALAGYDAVVTRPCNRWTHSIVVRPGDPLLDTRGPVTLEQLVQYLVITYELGYTGRARIDGAFARECLGRDIVLTAMDADVSKTYGELDIGVGIVASIAVDEERDRHLRLIDAGNLFEVKLTRRSPAAGLFIQSFVPTLTRDAVHRAAQQGAGAERDDAA